jgi:septin 7
MSEDSRDAFASDTLAVAPPASDSRNIVRRKLTGYVGFANLPNQWHRKSVRKGFNFNVMVVGTYLQSLWVTVPNDWARR